MIEQIIKGLNVHLSSQSQHLYMLVLTKDLNAVSVKSGSLIWNANWTITCSSVSTLAHQICTSEDDKKKCPVNMSVLSVLRHLQLGATTSVSEGKLYI